MSSANLTREETAARAAGIRLHTVEVDLDVTDDGVDIAAAPSLYRRFRERSEVWKYGLRPDEVDRFLDGYGWRLLDQLGPDQARDRYVRPTGRALRALHGVFALHPGQ